MTKIFILILNYKRHQDTINCINSIKRSDLPANSQIVIIDNSPTRRSWTILRKVFPQIKLIKTPRNNGFAYGNNYGIRFALKNHASHIMIINPDVSVARNFLKPLLRVFASHPQAGLVSPVQEHQQNKQTFFGLGGKVNWKNSKCEHLNTKKIIFKSARKYEFVSFACVLISAKVIDSIGLLDERYFMYLEDVDYCLTANRAGYSCYLEPGVKVKHNTSSSFKIPTQKLKISFVSQLKFINKWLKPSRRPFAFFYMIFFYLYLYFLWTYHYYKNR